jgi:predicted amidohydrolase YtcJ
VLLSADLFQVPPDEIKTVRPLLTVMDGKIVFED